MSDNEETEGNPTGSDPVTDFLVREQSQLAQLDDNFDSFNATQENDENEDFNSSQGYGTVSTSAASPSHGYESGHGHSDDQYNAAKSDDQHHRQEPEKIRKWRSEQAQILLKKDAESEKKKAEWRELAKRELEEWYKHREELLEKAKKANREAQDMFVEERDDKKPGREWEQICRLCDFSPKGSRNTKDVSRLRSILLQLKQQPAEAQ